MDKYELSLLAKQFSEKTLNIQAGDQVHIEYYGEHTVPLLKSCVEQITSLGATAHTVNRGSSFMNQWLRHATPDDFLQIGKDYLETIKQRHVYLAIDDEDDSLLIDLPDGIFDQYWASRREATSHRVKNLRWLVISAPTESMAKKLNMDVKAFEALYNKVCLLDYTHMGEVAAPLAERLRNGKNVEITGRNTHLSFSIENIGAVVCAGTNNIPDGEVYTSPVKHSINGHIEFEPSTYNGSSFNKIALTFKNGQITDAVADNDKTTERLNAILNEDEGARYIGEFAIAFNPYIEKPMRDILFDEKIKGSFHLTPGKAYQDETNNGNTSSIHWDMVKIQRPDYGGGDIIIDGELIRRNGLFVPKDLQPLNPENLLG